MPLPPPNTAWPPFREDAMYAKMVEWAAWYSGEPTRIIDAYAAQQAQGTIATPWWRFWSRARASQDGAQRAMLHVPIASDLAAVSGALLFGEPPKIRVRAAREMDAMVEAENQVAEAKAAEQAKAAPPDAPPDAPDTESEGDAGALKGTSLFGAPPQPEAKPKAVAPPETPEEKAEARLLEIAEKGDMYARLVEAAETAAAIGGVYIYPVWDEDLRDVPLLGIAQADMALPRFKWGFLQSVMFHRVVSQDGNIYWRHVESHEVEGTGESRKAVVLNGLYKGNERSLGEPQPLGTQAATAKLQPRVELPFSELDVEYIPNIRPNRLFRASGHGVADIQGSETLLDALDETYASWMRDVRLAKARIIVPNEYLRPDPDGHQAFDIDQEIYVGMDMEPGLTQDARTMLAHQFAIRFEEHRATAENLIERIVSNAGYTANTLGTASVEGASASSIRVSDHKTLLTLRKKSGWWKTAIANVLFHMQAIDKEIFKSGIEPIRPTVITADSIIDSPLELAQTVLALKTAEAASTETRVRMMHPDWSTSEVAAEVAKIEDAVEAAKPPPPSFGGGGFGKPNDDPTATGSKPVTADGPPKGNTTPPPQPGKKPF